VEGQGLLSLLDGHRRDFKGEAGWAVTRSSTRGTGYYCDWDSYNGSCESDVGLYDFNYDYEYFGTFQEVPEPTLSALLGVGLFWLIALRRRA
jgi:hypothetical protein